MTVEEKDARIIELENQVSQLWEELHNRPLKLPGVCSLDQYNYLIDYIQNQEKIIKRVNERQARLKPVGNA